MPGVEGKRENPLLGLGVVALMAPGDWAASIMENVGGGMEIWGGAFARRVFSFSDLSCSTFFL